MKILFCAYDRSNHLATGPNAWLQRLVPDLISNYGLDIQTLFVYSGVSKKCPTISYFKENNLPIHLINSNTHNYVEDQIKELLGIIKKEDISLVVANLVIPALYATQYLKPFNIPVIGVMHSNDTFYQGVITKFIHGKSKNQLSTAVSVSDYIKTICTSKQTQTQLLNIPCGTPQPNIRTSRSTEDKYFKIMYAGRLEIQQKQILKLVNAFVEASSLNPNLEFSIYGDGTEFDQVQSILGRRQGHNVHFYGAVKPSEILDVMANHHVITLMSDYEGMPVALMEGMASGIVPVCLQEESGINEIIKHGVNGFIVKDRDKDYQDKLQLLFNDVTLWETLSKNAIATIKHTYSSEITHKKWFELLSCFESLTTKQLRLPITIKVEGDQLPYGDYRKPSIKTRIKQQCTHNWLAFKMAVRPRARLKSFLKK